MGKKLVIYKATNTETDMVYIGATKNSIKERKLDHKSKASIGSINLFHDAIATYGFDVFTWEQIDTAQSIDELAQKEQQYISKYNSRNNGYNSDIGGGFKKTVYQYNLENKVLINTYDCLESAANAIDSTKQHISRACLNVNQIYGGFYWSYEYKEHFTPKTDNRLKEVYQFTLDGSFLYSYKSVSEANRVTGVNKGSIAKVCRGERVQSGGYL